MEKITLAVENNLKWIDLLNEPKVGFSCLTTPAGYMRMPCVLGRGRVHFLFNTDAPVMLQFSPHYARELARQKHYLIYNPEADVAFELSCTEKHAWYGFPSDLTTCMNFSFMSRCLF